MQSHDLRRIRHSCVPQDQQLAMALEREKGGGDKGRELKTEAEEPDKPRGELYSKQEKHQTTLETTVQVNWKRFWKCA